MKKEKDKKDIEKALDKKVSRGKFLGILAGLFGASVLASPVVKAAYPIFLKNGDGELVAIDPQADGFIMKGGGRTFNLNSGNVEIQGSGSATITFPSSTSTLATTSLSETLTNKTLGSGTKINPGSTSSGDFWYSSDSNGTVTTVSIGSAGQFFKVNAGGTAPEWADSSENDRAEFFSSGPDSVTATRWIGSSNADTTEVHMSRIMPAGTIKAMYVYREVDAGTATINIYKNGTFITGATVSISSGTTTNVTGLSTSFNGTTDLISVEVVETTGPISGNYKALVYYTPSSV